MVRDCKDLLSFDGFFNLIEMAEIDEKEIFCSGKNLENEASSFPNFIRSNAVFY